MRIHQIDALRGFALFGILVVNIFVFHAPYPHYGEFYFQFVGTEIRVLENMFFFFAGKFMFIYAFLFGYSFWLQYEKAEQEDTFRSYWNRRMLLLACFGVLHIFFLSFGDILLPYAILGLSLPFFARLSNKKVLLWFFLIYLIPVYEFVLRGFVEYPSIFMQPVVPLENYIEINGQGSFFEILKLRIQDYFSLKNEKLIMYIPKEISLFLIGMLAAKSKLASKLDIKKGLVFCVFALLVVGIIYLYKPGILSLFDYENSLWQRIVVGLIIQFSEFVHGMLYIIGFWLLWNVTLLKSILFPLTYTGRLSLTNYIMQSLICVILFSGLGYYAQLSPTELITLACAIYLMQLVFSFLWLKRNKYGPLEAVWRKYSR